MRKGIECLRCLSPYANSIKQCLGHCYASISFVSCQDSHGDSFLSGLLFCYCLLLQDCMLGDILDEDDVLQECKTQNKKLSDLWVSPSLSSSRSPFLPPFPPPSLPLSLSLSFRPSTFQSVMPFAWLGCLLYGWRGYARNAIVPCSLIKPEIFKQLVKYVCEEPDDDVEDKVRFK